MKFFKIVSVDSCDSSSCVSNVSSVNYTLISGTLLSTVFINVSNEINVNSQQYIWIYNKDITHNPKITILADGLVINNVSISDAGYYSAITANSLQCESAHFRLSVLCKLHVYNINK